MIEYLRPRDFLQARDAGGQVIDVRSPKEFEAGHIPGAVNMPLFTDEERATVGTLYKHQGKDAAVLKGLEFVGPKMKAMVLKCMHFIEDGKTEILVHCWRGGMRSGSVAWLLETSGLKVRALRAGYKGYRNFIRHQFTLPEKVLILGGLTGSGKTEILKDLSEMGYQFLDLEGLAHHKGSAFGPLGQLPQPTTEQFENDCFEVWRHFDLKKLILLEGESANIGKVRINEALLEVMKNADQLIVELVRDIRLDRIMNEYGSFNIEDLKNTSIRIEKKLGGDNLHEVLKFLDDGDVRSAASILLDYYDRTYWYSLKKKNKHWVDHLILKSDSALQNAEVVKDRIERYLSEGQ